MEDKTLVMNIQQVGRSWWAITAWIGSVVGLTVIAACIATVVLISAERSSSDTHEAMTTPVKISIPAPTTSVTITVTPDLPTPMTPDQVFLETLAEDGIQAPDNWALQAGRITCGGLWGADLHGSAYEYLTSGGIHPEHVDAFLEAWADTHSECHGVLG